MLKCVIQLYLLLVVSSVAAASEGFYHTAPSPIEAQKSIVRISTKLKVKFNVISPSLPYIDAEGFAVWEMSQNQAAVNLDNCKLDHFRFYPYIKEACKSLERGLSLSIPVEVEHAATGEIVSKDGFVLTAAHLVSNCALFSHATVPYRCSLLEITDEQGIEYSEVEVYFVGQGKDQDFAILKINRDSSKYLQLRSFSVAQGPNVAVGFPMVSKRPFASLRKHNYSDADGTIRFSYGSLISWTELSSTVQEKFRKLGYNEHSLLLSDIDVIPGNSGGAFLNKDGELIGITSGILDGKGPMYANPITTFMPSKDNPALILSTESICRTIAEVPSLKPLQLCK